MVELSWSAAFAISAFKRSCSESVSSVCKENQELARCYRVTGGGKGMGSGYKP